LLKLLLHARTDKAVVYKINQVPLEEVIDVVALVIYPYFCWNFINLSDNLLDNSF